MHVCSELEKDIYTNPLCMFVRRYVCMHACMYVCMNEWFFLCVLANISIWLSFVHPLKTKSNFSRLVFSKQEISKL